MYQRLDKSAADAAAYRINEPLTKEEIKQIASELEGIISVAGEVKVLIDLQAFPYADLGGLWEDLKFDVKHAGDMTRLALVGGNKVEEWSMRIFSTLSRTECRCFAPGQEEIAWDWLIE